MEFAAIVNKHYMGFSKNQDWIELKGVRENNLKNISVKIPKNKITVVTGLSGSGKSSLVFETLFLESQRRFLDGLSNYSKNFLDTFKKPELDSLKEVSPSIAVDQKTAGSSPRSTVGTMTEVLDYLRLLYARLGEPRCPKHGQFIKEGSKEGLYEWASKNFIGKKIRILCPIVQSKKGEFTKELEKWQSFGFLKAYVNGKLMNLSEIPKLHKRKNHSIDLVVDQFKFEKKLSNRLKKSIKRSFNLLKDVIAFKVNEKRVLFSIKAACTECGFSFPELEPRHFSFNNRLGACEDCGGLGTQDILEIEDQDQIGSGGIYMNLKKKSYKSLVDGTPSFCETCKGLRLNQRALSVFIDNKNIADFSAFSIQELISHLENIKFKGNKKLIFKPIFKEIKERLCYLKEVGTGYLSLDRKSESLSGGERQRLRLASQLGSPLIGVLYVLDEPSIGLHLQDHRKLLKIIQRLKNQGNTVVIVEHDEDTMRIADFIIEVGPGAGAMGGEIVSAKVYNKFLSQKPETLTSSFLNRTKKIVRLEPKKIDLKNVFSIKNANLNNLKNVDIDFPVGTMIGVSGVSGSGKSSLIMDTLAQSESFKNSKTKFKNLNRFNVINKIDQKPIGKTPRSTPATYVGVYQLIRSLFARLAESQVRGFKVGHFSFNSELGRCGECAGNGVKKLGSHFLTNISVSCTTCNGKRFKPEVLTVQFKGKNISDILQMSVNQAYKFFQNQNPIRNKLKTMLDVGLGYINLGQDSTTLSGGESQRLKLSKELSKIYRGDILYILDEPTTGLHFQDIDKLINLLSNLVKKGHTVIIIEHQLDILGQCDYIVDLGPEGGKKGGFIVDKGSPKEIAKKRFGPTGRSLAAFLKQRTQ